jgi:hypothetical protein
MDQNKGTGKIVNVRAVTAHDLLTSADSRNFRFTRLENSNITH